MNTWAVRVSAILAALAVSMTTIGSVSAITFGEPTTEGEYTNVGSLIGTIDGESYQWCTGTLIGTDDFLTAAHCVLGFPEDVEFSVTFDQTIDADENGLIDATVNRIGVDDIFTPEQALTGGANNTYDMAVLKLAASPGLTPASLAPFGTLDQKALRTERFVTVGYGTVRNDKTGGSKSFMPASERLNVIQTINSVTKAWVTFSMNPSTGNGGTCYGDSGGPHFNRAGQIVSLTVTGDAFCRSTDKTYRVDTQAAQVWILAQLNN